MNILNRISRINRLKLLPKIPHSDISLLCFYLWHIFSLDEIRGVLETSLKSLKSFFTPESSYMFQIKLHSNLPIFAKVFYTQYDKNGDEIVSENEENICVKARK